MAQVPPQKASNKVLLMGRAGAGKTSMRSIIFANYLARETSRLHPTNQVEHSNLRFLGNLILNLWDCGGQDVFMENYFESQREHIFRNVNLLIYVLGSVTNEHEMQKDFGYFKNSMDSLRQLSPNSKVYCLVHKLDLLREGERMELFNDFTSKLREIANPTEIVCFPTSIWDETLYRAWSQIVHSMIPNIGSLEIEMKRFCESLGPADEVVLFEKATFLVIASHTHKEMNDPHRFEKISNIVKQFKLSVNKHRAYFTTFKVQNALFRCIIERFTSNTFVMVITSDMSIQPAATQCCIAAARSHFLKLADDDNKGLGVSL